MGKQSRLFRLFSKSSSWFPPLLALQTMRVGYDREGKRERESPGFLKCEYSPGWKPVPLPCKHMLFEFNILPVPSPAAPTFSLWQSCHACYFTENTIWYRRSPSSFYLSIGKDPGQRGKRKAKWKWQAGERSNSLWHEALKTPHLHSNTARTEWIAAQSQRKPTNNVPQHLWAQSGSIT